jgi:hypothetical protein
VEEYWARRESEKQEAVAAAHQEKARQSLAAGRLGLAELYFGLVLKAAPPESDLAREARSSLQIIEKRRQTEVKILLQ